MKKAELIKLLNENIFDDNDIVRVAYVENGITYAKDINNVAYVVVRDTEEEKLRVLGQFEKIFSSDFGCVVIG